MQTVANYPLPLPAGTYTSENIHLQCSVDGNTLSFFPRFSNGNFVVGVYVRATDAMGIVMDQFVEVDVVHLLIQFVGSAYDQYMKGCALNRYGRVLKILTVPQPIPPEGNWNPEAIVALVQDMAILGSSVQEEVLAQAAMRFGSGVVRSFASGRRAEGTLQAIRGLWPRPSAPMRR